MRDTKLTSFKQLCHAYNFKFTYIRKNTKILKGDYIANNKILQMFEVFETIKIIKFVRSNDSQKPQNCQGFQASI